jgi:hypothetical protein
MSENDVRPTTGSASLPRPRVAADDLSLWPEPWHFARANRPRTEFWDAETAGWRSGGAVPSPRSGD